ncbi:MAG: helix-turn-helix transcriptional regulator [Puniceicoccales bacterium]|jgi:transcriptional regulator with XRE-family HTH domain|nr:helix-turn-helix transcriptional regulator [Puniceicoccales bacterium]
MEFESASVMEPTDFPIGKMIRILMNEARMTEADLCRGVNLPQTTINRLLSCQTNDPRISTVVAIAKFFDVTIEQLLGSEPILSLQMSKMVKGSILPILAWEQIASRLSQDGNMSENVYVQWIKTEKTLNPGSFATYNPTSTDDFFGGHGLLLISPYADSEVTDGQIVLVDLNENNFGLRQAFKEGNDVFLKRLFSPFEINPLSEVQMIKGYVVEMRKYLDLPKHVS